MSQETENDDVDFERISLLLDVATKVLPWPRMGSIHDRAVKELEAIARDLAGPGGVPVQPKQPPVPPVNK